MQLTLRINDKADKVRPLNAAGPPRVAVITEVLPAAGSATKNGPTAMKTA